MKKYDVVATIGTYKTNGEEKKIYRNVGAVLTTKNGGFVIKVDASFNLAALPNKTEDGSVWLSLFEPKEKSQPMPSSSPIQPAQVEDFKDEAIPF
jgi:hypothetical protein